MGEKEKLDMSTKNILDTYQENEILKCPNCISTNIHIKSGMFCDLYICQDCFYEWR